ncbi:hypothetical protein GCM10009839_08000 [Catenulispora yoronensis]|uniref:Uncharacterized protein n=1 Tax=Catenulispora yoronensis TaxID=450799 RepID=A0ABP5F7A3_9ACTN
MDARVDFAARSILNLRAAPEPLVHPEWDVITSLARTFTRYKSTEIEFHGVRNCVPEVFTLSPRSARGGTVHCVYTERSYNIAALLRTIAVVKVPDEGARRLIAQSAFLQLAADYLLQQGAHGDAARVYCASWLVKTPLLVVGQDAGMIETFLTNPMIESVMVEGGWPLAHELGHSLYDGDGQVVEWCADMLAQYVEHYFEGSPPRWGPPGARGGLLSELVADYFGAELILRTMGGRALDTTGWGVFLSEFAASMWAIMLMETCKEVVRLACEDPAAGRAAAASGQRAWMYDVRRRLLFGGIQADLSAAFAEVGQEDLLGSLIGVGLDASSMPGYAVLLTGLTDSQHMMMGLGREAPVPLLEGFGARAAQFWDPLLGREARRRARKTDVFRALTREFVNRARATDNFRGQDTGLLDLLDRLVPDVAPVLARRRLEGDETDLRITLPGSAGDH